MSTVPVLAAFATVALLGPLGGASRRVVVSDRDRAKSLPVRAWGRHRRWAFGSLVLAGSAVVFGPLIALGVAIAIGCRPRIQRIRTAQAVRREIDATLPDAVEMLILVVQSGMTPHQAVEMLAERAPLPIRPAFAEVRHRVTRGAPLADALGALPELLGAGANVVSDTLAMAERHGTPIGPALEQLSLDVRERRQRRAEAEARQLPIRMSFPLVACTLPSFVLVAIVPAVLAAMTSLGETGI
jgi:tight adherence protein C